MSEPQNCFAARKGLSESVTSWKWNWTYDTNAVCVWKTDSELWSDWCFQFHGCRWL